jgi:hypothetical protein
MDDGRGCDTIAIFGNGKTKNKRWRKNKDGRGGGGVVK